MVVVGGRRRGFELWGEELSVGNGRLAGVDVERVAARWCA